MAGPGLQPPRSGEQVTGTNRDRAAVTANPSDGIESDWERTARSNEVDSSDRTLIPIVPRELRPFLDPSRLVRDRFRKIGKPLHPVPSPVPGIPGSSGGRRLCSARSGSRPRGSRRTVPVGWIRWWPFGRSSLRHSTMALDIVVDPERNPCSRLGALAPGPIASVRPEGNNRINSGGPPGRHQGRDERGPK